jgi:phage baseplate assembly protein V
MPISRDLLDQLRHVVRPIATRVANTIARGVVTFVDDTTKMQLVQLALTGEPIDNAEHFQPYGFCSVPLEGAEHVVVFPNGDRSHPLLLAVSDRRFRPTGGQPGQVTMYNHVGARVVVLPDGTIEARSKDGTATKLPTLADYEALRQAFNDHTHVVSTTGGPAAQTGTAAKILPAAAVGSPTGTSVFKAE